MIQNYEFSDGRVFTQTQMLTSAGLQHAHVNALNFVTAISTGNDYLLGTTAADTIDALAGDDVIYGDAGDDNLTGNDGDDVIDGGLGVDTISGNDGDDRLYGSAGNDVMGGDAGKDALYGGAGDDTLHGGLDDDDLQGSVGDDTLYGDAGNDQLRGDAGIDHLEGGPGVDEYFFAEGDDPVSGSVIIDSGSNAIRFGVGIGPADVLLEIASDGTTLIVHYKDSSVAVPNGASGGVIDEFAFDGHASLNFTQMLDYNFIFADGFEGS